MLHSFAVFRPELLSLQQKRFADLALLDSLHRGNVADVQKSGCSSLRNFGLAVLMAEYEKALEMLEQVKFPVVQNWRDFWDATVPAAVLVWAAKTLPKIKKKETPLGLVRQRMKTALTEASDSLKLPPFSFSPTVDVSDFSHIEADAKEGHVKLSKACQARQKQLADVNFKV